MVLGGVFIDAVTSVLFFILRFIDAFGYFILGCEKNIFLGSKTVVFWGGQKRVVLTPFWGFRGFWGFLGFLMFFGVFLIFLGFYSFLLWWVLMFFGFFYVFFYFFYGFYFF